MNPHTFGSIHPSKASMASKTFKAFRKVLIITYYWPPGSGAGVQRWLKFSKYLPEFGWQPVILTIDPDYASYPATDHSLKKDIPESVKVYPTRATDYFRVLKSGKSAVPSAGFASGNEDGLKARIIRFIRGNFFIPDPRRGWNRYAFGKACEIIENENIKHIITTSPPHSSQLIGFNLKKKYPAIRWISDLRDPWIDIYYYQKFYHTFPARQFDKYLERKILLSADRIITVGKSLKDLFSAKFHSIENKIEVITNGYDEEDFPIQVHDIPEKFTISYIGTLSDAYPVEGLAAALSALKAGESDFVLKFIGAVSKKQKELLLAGVSNSIEFIPYVDHEKAIRYMNESTMLLLIIPDHHSNKSILTGKIFEYIASGKPVLCLGPVDGDAAEILRISEHGKSAGYNDVKGIIDIIRFYMSHPEKKDPPSEFSRRILTGKLASVLESS